MYHWYAYTLCLKYVYEVIIVPPDSYIVCLFSYLTGHVA